VSRVLYFDAFSGISGDMTLGALLGACLPLADLERALGSLTLGVELRVTNVLRSGIRATRFEVVAPGAKPEDHAHRHLNGIYQLIDRAALSASARDRAKHMFERLAATEAAIHQTPIERVHLHEVGAIDSIIDIVGVAFAMEWAAADRVVCSPLNVGGGSVQTAHGRLPVPAPATLAILGSTPIYSGPIRHELVTPTGALIATTFANAFGPMPAMTVDRIGYGAGARDHQSEPNVLRVLIGDETPVTRAASNDRVTVVECEIEAMNPQIFGVGMEKLSAAGALEVFYVAVQMKKNRPGTLLTVIAQPQTRHAIADVIFRETTTIGVRYHDVDRECLPREIVPVETPVGTIRFKVSRRDGRVLTATPEFDDCARAAAAHHLAVRDVQTIAIKAFTS